MSNSESMEDREEELRQRVKELGPEERKKYYTLLEKEVRDPDTYAVLNYFFIAGLHHFYLRKWLRGLINLGLMIYGITILFGSYGEEVAGIGVLIIGGVYLFELFELFRSQNIVSKHNYDVSVKLLQEVQKGRGKR